MHKFNYFLYYSILKIPKIIKSMEEESKLNDDSNQKTFKITSDKENKYIVTFKNIKSTSLLIEAVFDDENNETFFESEFTLDEIKENKAFLSYDSIDEILEELFPLIDENKIHLIEEDGNKILISFMNRNPKFNLYYKRETGYARFRCCKAFQIHNKRSQQKC